MEVYQSNLYFWTTLCADGFDQMDANVVCKQLGYSRARVLLPGQFGRSLKYIHTVSINCSGDETDILDCQHGIGFCSSFNYASVLCTHLDTNPGEYSQLDWFLIWILHSFFYIYYNGFKSFYDFKNFTLNIKKIVGMFQNMFRLGSFHWALLQWPSDGPTVWSERNSLSQWLGQHRGVCTLSGKWVQRWSRV